MLFRSQVPVKSRLRISELLAEKAEKPEAARRQRLGRRFAQTGQIGAQSTAFRHRPNITGATHAGGVKLPEDLVSAL